MGATQLKTLSFLLALTFIPNGNSISNGIEDEKNLSIVKLVNKEESSMCSGTVIGTNPVTVLTAFHCAFLSQDGEIYLDLRSSVKEVENLNKIIEAINPPKQVDLSMFKDLKPIELGNGLKFDPKNIPENGVMTFGGPIKAPPAPLLESWKATKFILSPTQTQSAEFKEYEESLSESLLVQTKLSIASMKLNQISQNSSPLTGNLSLSVSDLSFITKKSSEQVALENEITSLSEEYLYINRMIEANKNALFGRFVSRQKATDVVIIVFENHKLDGTLEQLQTQNRFTPVLSDLKYIEDDNAEFTLHGYGKSSVFDEPTIKKAIRRKSKNINTALSSNEDPGFIKFRGLLKDVKSEKFPPGSYSSMLEGDSGGSIQRDGAVVGIYSQYQLNQIKNSEIYENWPHYHKHTGDSEFIEFFAVRTDAEATHSLLEHAQTQGADVIYKDAETGKIFRKSQP